MSKKVQQSDKIIVARYFFYKRNYMNKYANFSLPKTFTQFRILIQI